MNLKLPEYIQKIQSVIENFSGTSVVYKLDQTIAGNMMAKIENKIPVVRYREEPPSIEGIAHELLHLKLEYEGYHLLLPPEQDRLISQTAVILQNVMHHHIIFPILERWGYNPRQGECCGTKNQLCILREADFNRLNNEQSLCSLFAMVYVRGMLDCNDINIQ